MYLFLGRDAMSTLIGETIWLGMVYSPLFLWREAWRHADRYGAGEVTERSTSGAADNRKRQSQEASLEHFTTQRLWPVTHNLQKGHTYFNKDIAS